jgi:uncharacterized protein (DUF1778 family)
MLMVARQTDMETNANKTARFEAGITAEQKSLFLKAATLAGRSLSDFVVICAQEAANRTVQEHEAMTLSIRDRKAFVAALLKPPAPGARLRTAARRYKWRVATGMPQAPPPHLDTGFRDCR